MRLGDGDGVIEMREEDGVEGFGDEEEGGRPAFACCWTSKEVVRKGGRSLRVGNVGKDSIEDFEGELARWGCHEEERKVTRAEGEGGGERERARERFVVRVEDADAGGQN